MVAACGAAQAGGGLLRTRGFGLLWAGESISGFGSAITTVALPLVAVSTLHASVGTVALLTAATWLPWMLIGLPAGTWVDRWPRRRTLLTAALAAGTSSMFFSLAFNAYLPHLLTPDDRLEGNARLQTSAQAAQVAGPGLVGLLAQLAGPVCGLLADALTFLVSATARPQPTQPSPSGLSKMSVLVSRNGSRPSGRPAGRHVSAAGRVSVRTPAAGALPRSGGQNRSCPRGPRHLASRGG